MLHLKIVTDVDLVVEDDYDGDVDCHPKDNEPFDVGIQDPPVCHII